MENGEYNSNQANPNDIADGSKDVRKTHAESRENQENAPNDKGCAPELKDNAQDGMKCGDKSHHAADNSPTERQNANKSGIQSSETMTHAHMLPPQTMLRRSVRFREIRLSPSNAFWRRKSETFKSASFRFCCAAKDAHPGAHDDCRHAAAFPTIMAHLRRDAHRYRDVAHSSPKQTPRYQSRVPLSEAISTREALMEKKLKLRIELRALSRRERLEPYATQQLGMAAIRPDQILIVRRPKPSDAPVGQTDGLGNIRRNAD